MTKTSHDSEVLAEGQQVMTACALIHKEEDGKHLVFLPRRAKTKKFLPGVFELPGGHIDFGESLIEGLKREIREEFGVGINVGSPFAAFTYVNDIKKSHSIEVIYFAKFTEPEDNIKLDSSDHSEYKWVSLETISDVFTGEKSDSDIEFKCLRQGLEILSGADLDIGA